MYKTSGLHWHAGSLKTRGMNKMTIPSRIIIGLSSLSLITAYFLPVWFIFLIAPQYPEGLTMNIWLNKITGQVDIINGLNHYIGMKHISADMFPEFGYLVYILGFFIVFGLVIAITGNRKLLLVYLILTILGGAAAIYDFYQWGYQYGHNLDPKAPIQVPGLYYQPPVIGHKTLLNFDAYSYPAAGGWIIIGACALFFLVWMWEGYRNRKGNVKGISVRKNVIPSLAALLVFTITSCSTKPEPFAFGKDLCAGCSMTIMDSKFGAEIITNKGKLLKFDDAHCIAHYINTGHVKQTDIAQTVFVDYENNQSFLDANTLFFVVSPQLKSPMNSNAAAFSNREKAEAKAKATGGYIKTWSEVLQNIP
jgi:copper chaperone NosL